VSTCTVCNTRRRIYNVYCFTHIPCFAMRPDNRHAVHFPKCYMISCVVYLCERPKRKQIKSLLKKQTLEMPSSCFWKLRFRSSFFFFLFFTKSISSLLLPPHPTIHKKNNLKLEVCFSLIDCLLKKRHVTLSTLYKHFGPCITINKVLKITFPEKSNGCWQK